MRKQPISRYRRDQLTLGVYRDLESFGGSIEYVYAVLLYDNILEDCVGFVTLETSQSMKYALCYFDPDGEHHNFGDLAFEDNFEEANVTQFFFSGVGLLLEEKYGEAELEIIDG